MKCDVVVIGAGPSGSMAAKSAAQAGLDVLLLEKRQEIGEPIRCAEGVAIRSELRDLIDVDPSWISTEVKGVWLYSPSGSNVFTTEENGGEEGGYVLDRKTFDRGLALQAMECGARVLVKTRATGLDRIGGRFLVSALGQGEPLEIEAPLVIGADGIESKVARWAGLESKLSPEDILVCAQFQVCGGGFDRDYCHFFFGSDLAPGGYIWIFPKGGSLANVGIGLQGSRSLPGLPLRLLESFLERKMPDAKILQMMAGGIPTSGQMKSIVLDGLMLAGDAAHQSDPLTGGGIINSMRAGIIAGEVAAKAISSGDVSRQGLGEYEERCRSSLGVQIENSLNAKKFFLSLCDDDFNHLAASLQGHDISRMDTKNLLKFLFKQNPKMLWKMRSLLL
jgi:digeranylgeranylglycerophospholipid reductase